MKRLKKELSLLLAFALVLTSIGIGLAQIRTRAATDIMPGTGIFRVAIKIDKNSTGSKDSDLDKHRGTDSDFQLRLTGTDTNNFIGGTAANEISGLVGTGDGNTDPLENDKTTQYICTGGTTAGTASVIKTVASLGAVTVNRNITNIRLKCTTWVENYKFANVWVAYYYSGDKAGSFDNLTSTGCEATAGGQEHNWATSAFTTTYKKEITFDANGGSGGKAYDIIQGQTIGNSSSDLPTVTRTGYTFTGWNTAANGSGSSLTAGTTRMGGSDITYYAQWTPITYTVAYNGNGSTGGSTANSSHTYDTAKALTSNGFTRTGYTFAGWATSAGGSVVYTNGQSVSNLTTTNGATVTLYAKWTPITYTVAYNGNGSTGGSTASSSHTYDAAKNLTTNGFTRTGHTFAGWATSAGGSVVYTNGQSVSNLTTTNGATVTLYANWTVNSYNVTFLANGGTGTMAPQAIPYGTSANLNANTFTRSGYAFTGWNTLANGTGTAYGPGASFGPMTEAGATLYAQWEKSEYDLIFNANGGSGTMTNQTINVGSTAAIKANTFTRTGYSFKNWNTLANGTGTTYANQANFTMGSSDTTLYAQWNINSYTISFNSDGGTAVAPITQNYATAVTAPANPEKTGYQFSGWLPTVPTTMPANNTNCVAQWTINQYTVSYQSNGGTAVPSNTVNYNTQINAPTQPTRTGYAFGGWYKDAGLTQAVSWPYTVTANATLYAKWTAYTYTVTYNGNGNTGGSTANSSHTYDVAKALTTNGYIKTGYTFTGWNTAANGSGTGYTNGQSVTNLSSTNGATVTLYAQWTINNYTISFDSDGGSAVSPITQPYGSTVSPPANPTKAGFVFDGWLPAVPATMPAENTTCVAQWKANTYTVAYNANNATGGTVPSSHSHTIGGSNSLASNSGSLARTGYSFVGWNTQADGTGTNYAAGASNVGDLSSTPNTTVTLYAKWQGNAHTVTFDANGGTGGGTVNLNYGDPLTPPTVRRVGYAFQGWSPGVPATVEGDKTYVAQWAETSVSVRSADNDKLAVDITGFSEDYSYQIWTYQLITSDDLLDTDEDVPANQWILSMAYTKGSQGSIQNSTLTFEVNKFSSPNENYTIALRIADENGDYVFELRDSYTPEDLNEAVITKVLVDGEYVKGSAQNDGDGHSNNRVVKEIKSGATTTIKVVGNLTGLTYTATVYETGQELTVSNDNEFIWDISGLEPRNYSVIVTAKNGNSEDKRTVHFTLYSTSYSDYVEIDTLDVTGGGVYSNPNQNITITPDFTNTNGYFFYKIHEPGRKAQITNGNFTENDPITQPMEKYGYYQLTGLVNRTSGLLNPSGYDDGIIKFFNMKRNAGASSLAVTTKSGGATVNTSNPVAKGTALRIEGSATIAGIGSVPVQYSFWRYDAKGYVLVKDWSSDNFLDWTPGKVGVYNIEVRAKGEDAGSYEVHKSIGLTVTYTGEPMAEGVNISVAFGSSPVQARVPVVISASATSTNSDDLLYKFYVHDEFMKTRTLQNYSANQECLWTPRKAGTYDILVLVKNQNSYGKYDAIKKVTVTVQ